MCRSLTYFSEFSSSSFYLFVLFIHLTFSVFTLISSFFFLLGFFSSRHSLLHQDSYSSSSSSLIEFWEDVSLTWVIGVWLCSRTANMRVYFCKVDGRYSVVLCVGVTARKTGATDKKNLHAHKHHTEANGSPFLLKCRKFLWERHNGEDLLIQ